MASQASDKVNAENVSIELVLDKDPNAVPETTGETQTVRGARRTSIFTLGQQIWADEIKIRERIRRTKITAASFGSIGILIYILNSLTVFGETAQLAVFFVTVFFLNNCYGQ